MTHARIISLLTALLLTASACWAGSPDKPQGDWHGLLTTPMGQLTLIVTITKDDDGALSAQLESPDQAPGQKIPVTSVRIDDQTLRLEINAIGAKYEGAWDEENTRWEGVLTQGIELPLTLEPGLPPAKPVVEGLDGRWEGALMRNGVELRLALRISTDDNGTSAYLDSPDMGAVGIPISALSHDEGSVSFSVMAAGVSFKGALAGEAITGTWSRPGMPDTDVTFTRSHEMPAPPKRPQYPSEPYPYQSLDVTFENPWTTGVTIAGTLTIPNQDEGPFPAAILISGSGPQDRDETVFGHKPFLVLADHLTRSGIAVLRYDDRGVGRSSGDFSASTSADFATDANAALRYLASRPEIDADKIGFIGHSEGGMIAPIAMNNTNNQAAYLVMLAGPGTDTRQIITSQTRLIALSQGDSEANVDRREPVIRSIVDAVAGAKNTDDAKARIGALLTPEAMERLGVGEEAVPVIVGQYTSPWFVYFLSYDPADFLPAIRVPILAINGSNDLQVPSSENLERIRALTADNQDATVIELAGLNHMFQTSETGSMGRYGDIEETFAPHALELISHWINARFGS